MEQLSDDAKGEIITIIDSAMKDIDAYRAGKGISPGEDHPIDGVSEFLKDARDRFDEGNISMGAFYLDCVQRIEENNPLETNRAGTVACENIDKVMNKEIGLHEWIDIKHECSEEHLRDQEIEALGDPSLGLDENLPVARRRR
jgi:hypothetical protein